MGGKLVLITNIGSRIWAFDRYQNRRPWMTLNDKMVLILHYFTESTRLRLHTYCIDNAVTSHHNDFPLNYLFTVKSGINQFRIILIVTNYIDISRKINYNRNRQFRRLIGTIISVYVLYYISINLAVYSTTRDRLFSSVSQGSRVRIPQAPLIF